MKHNFLKLLFLFLITSCNKEPKANDDFRENALTKVKVQADSLKAFEVLLDKLDKKDTEFGDYYKKSHYTIQDSCNNLMVIKYGEQFNEDYSNSVKLQEELYKITVDALKKYDDQFNIHSDTSQIAQDITTLNPTIKRYLNKKFSLNLFIPEK